MDTTDLPDDDAQLADVVPFTGHPTDLDPDPDDTTDEVPVYGTPDETSDDLDTDDPADAIESDDVTDDESDDVDDAPLVRVDPPGTDRVSYADIVNHGARRPVLPAWATSMQGLRAGARWVASHYVHVTAFHGVRLPVYVARLVLRSPVGSARVVRAVIRWIWDLEGLPVRNVAVRREDPEMYLKLSRQRDSRVRARTGISIVLALVAVTGFLAGALTLPSSLWWAMLAAVVAGCGLAGGRADVPLAGPAVIAPQVTRLSADIVIRALGSLGLAGINQALRKGLGIAFVAPITRDGPGWRADLDLPYGVTVANVLDKRTELASGLRRPLGCVWPEAATDAHAGRLVLWVGDQDMAKAPLIPWPLAAKGSVDLFQPVPVGTDPRGRCVSVSLLENNVLIGSLPGGGKTATARVYLLAAGLDPTGEVWGFNLKNNNDIASAKKFATRYASGVDDTTIELVVQALRDLKVDVQRRAETIKGLPVELCPDGKVTRSLANRRTLGLHPLVMFVDECQNLFSHPTFGKEAGEIAEYIIKLGRALGVILMLATQRPDKASLPTGISANVSIRFCLRVTGQTENDMILGTSFYQNGIRATEFRPSDRGIGYLVGAGDEPQIVKSAYIDLPAAEKIADRARAARIKAGLLNGYAIDGTNPGTTPDGVATSNLLDDLIAVFPAGEAKVWSETLVERLADLRPALYTGWEATNLSSALKPYGVDTVQIGRRVDGKVVNRWGVVRTGITNLIAERDRKRNAS
jgi:S-DNA-T family DNA segregation ATPase FtsK/SpoIIIE